MALDAIPDTDIVARMLEDPACYSQLSFADGFTLSQADVERIHLSGLQKRFAELRPKISVLDNLASDQGIDKIEKIDDAARLLFPHTVYKSYPLSFIERRQFDRLTRWLQGVTSIDLSGYTSDGVDSIDSWIQRLDETTELRLIHSSGTSGKLSFVPRGAQASEDRLRIFASFVRDWHGKGTGPDLLRDQYPVIYPGYRYGSSAQHRYVDLMARLYAGGEENILCLYPDDYFSADIASLAGRLKVADARGEAGKLDLPPSLLQRREEFVRREQERPQRLEAFFAEAEQRFGGRDVLAFAMWPLLFDWAQEGLARGVSNLFGPRSVVQTGGGSKGRVLPDNAREIISEFLGFERLYDFYGMSEMSGNCPQCEHGNYHIPPFTVPYVLDPDTGEPQPRTGVQTGRFAIFDLLPTTHWAGFISGDKVSVGWWDQPCACGRTGPYVKPPIQRYSELQGGDDKISCAGAPDAHDRAMQFLAELAD